MKKTVNLPISLAPHACQDLIRLGKDFDGGYLVCRRDVETSDALLGLGVYKDWSFEREFRDLNKVRVETYDRSVGGRFFVKEVFRKLLRFYNLAKLVQAVSNVFSYFYFFSRDGVAHHRQFIGVDSPPKVITLKEAASRVEGKNIFLKIDIEGSEYRVLNDLLEMADQTSGLAIEFHDCDLHMERIMAFIDAYPLTLVHLHVNSGTGLSREAIPLVMEMTFSKAEKSSGATVSLPHVLDMPNKKGESQFEVNFTN